MQNISQWCQANTLRRELEVDTLFVLSGLFVVWKPVLVRQAHFQLYLKTELSNPLFVCVTETV